MLASVSAGGVCLHSEPVTHPWGAAVAGQRLAMTLGNKEVWQRWEAVSLHACALYGTNTTSGTSE